MTDDKQLREDMQFLNQREEFRRFLFRVIQISGILSRTTDGSGERDLSYDEGRRNLGLQILEMAETGQPVAHPEGLPLLTLMQALREEAQAKPEKPNVRRNQYDRNSELDEPMDAEADSA